MIDPKSQRKPPAPRAPQASAKPTPVPTPARAPRPPAFAKDAKTFSAAVPADRKQSSLHKLWEQAVVAPVRDAQGFWRDAAKQGGAAGTASAFIGGALEVSGVPAIAESTGTALDARKPASERLKGGGLAAGHLAVHFVPIGKVAGVGAKAFQVVGGAKAVQKLRNALLLGAEVPAGTVIKHYTNAGAAATIAAEGVLGGSKRGFLTMAGKGERLAMTAKGLEKRAANNGQVYAMAADGRTSPAGKVVDAIVGVGGDTTLGKVLGKVSPPKTGYSHVVEHVLTAEEALGARRWGKTIVTNVPTGKAGLAITAAEVKAVPGVVAAASVKPANGVAKAAEEVFGKGVEQVVQNADLLAVGYGKLLLNEQ